MKDIIIEFWISNHGILLNFIWKLLFAAAVLGSGKIAVITVNKIISKTCSVISSFDETLVPVITTISSYSIYAVCTVIVLDIFGVNTTSIIALLGAAGIAVGLALKDTLANIASGIMLLILRPFRKNDFIEFGSIAGTVSEIGLFATIMETPDGIYISSPNSSIWGVPLRNYTRNGKRRIDIIIGISYRDSIDTAFNVMQKIIDDEKRFLSEPLPQIMVSSIADSSINIQLRAWTTVEDFWDVRWKQNKNVKEKIEAAGLTIPFPRQDVNIINDKAAKGN